MTGNYLSDLAMLDMDFMEVVEAKIGDLMVFAIAVTNQIIKFDFVLRSGSVVSPSLRGVIGLKIKDVVVVSSSPSFRFQFQSFELVVVQRTGSFYLARTYDM